MHKHIVTIIRAMRSAPPALAMPITRPLLKVLGTTGVYGNTSVPVVRGAALRRVVLRAFSATNICVVWVTGVVL